jgi:hypothetical protein
MRSTTISVALVLGLVLTMTSGRAEDQVVEPDHPQDHTFTHQTGQSTTCSRCHSCEHPNREKPCLISCPRHGTHFYGEHDVDEGPEIVIIDQLANLYRPVVFAHRLHADMSTMSGGCENCHHYSERSGTIPPCRDCHDESKGPVNLQKPALKGAYHRQCMNCHLDWSHQNACGFCHEEADGSRPAAVDSTDIVGIPHPLIEATHTYTYETTYGEAPLVSFHHTDHVEMFGLKCVDCHRGDSCSSCHHGADETPQRARVDHVTTCCSCHGERDCGFCHAEEAKACFNHGQSTGWALEPFHTQVSCQTCHGSPQDFRTPSDQCASCHIHWEDGGFDHRVTGLGLNEDHVDLDCRDCHLEMDFSRQPSCEACHDEPMLPNQLPGRRSRAAS